MDAKTVVNGIAAWSRVVQASMQFGGTRGSRCVRIFVSSWIVRSDSLRILPDGVMGLWSFGCQPRFRGKVRLWTPIRAGGGGVGSLGVECHAAVYRGVCRGCVVPNLYVFDMFVGREKVVPACGVGASLGVEF